MIKNFKRPFKNIKHSKETFIEDFYLINKSHRNQTFIEYFLFNTILVFRVSSVLIKNCLYSYITHCQSPSSNKNISSTLVLNTAAIFNTRIPDGIYFPISIELMVCLETFTLSAIAAWVRLCLARSTFIVFFIRFLIGHKKI